MYEIKDDIIIDQVKQWTYNNIDPDFKFRKYQLEAIVNIIKNVLWAKKIQVMEAPTGSGKSFIGIISAGVLWEFYKKKSYLLASDLSLYRQYEEAIKKYNLPWGTLKGQDNYICSRNGHMISMAHCKIAMVPTPVLGNYMKASNMGYDCTRRCSYITDLLQAARAPVTLLTYALYFIRVKEHQMYTPLPDCPDLNLYPRDFVICDEAHNLPSLVQNQFAPEVDKNNLSYVVTLNEFAKENGDIIPSLESIQEVINYLIRFDDPEQIRVCCERMNQQFGALKAYCDEVVKATVKGMPADKKKDAVKYLNAAHSVADISEKFRVFVNLIETYTSRVIVKTLNKDGTGVRLNCAYEDKLIYEFFHKRAKQELLMSATIGNLDTYRNLIGGDNYPDETFSAVEVPSTFDFSQSPIYYDTRYRMSYREKATSLPKVISETIKICENNKDRRGIIHTGSYEISQELFKNIPPALRFRMIPYSNSKERNEAIKRFKNSSNGILIGPSCVEGLDFPGDGCRFNIFMKMPYASLADNLVKAKMSLFPDWYPLDVCSRLSQGIGRGVRYNGDWCNTYILDGCFEDILNNAKSSKNLSESTHKRLVKLS